MSRPALDRSALLAIDVSKLGPDSPLRDVIAKVERRKNPSRDLEHLSQVRLIEWVHENEQRYPALAWLFAVPNWFGTRTARQGARAKAEGRRAGVPDILFPVRRGSYVGLAIEMKAGKNTPSREQRLWLAHLAKQGWLTDVCYSFEEARDLILAYLSGDAPVPA